MSVNRSKNLSASARRSQAGRKMMMPFSAWSTRDLIAAAVVDKA
jgi:hypothetical protein